MLKYHTQIPLKFSYSLTCCTLYKWNLITTSPYFFLFLPFFSFLWDLLMQTEAVSPAAQVSAGCLAGRPPVLTFSVAHICLSITAWPPCYSFSNSEFLRQPAVLYRPQKYLSHCTTEIWKTICQGEVWLKCLSKTACRLEDNQSDAGIPNHTLRIKSKKKIKNHSQRQRKAWKKQIHFKCALCSERVYPT